MLMKKKNLQSHYWIQRVQTPKVSVNQDILIYLFIAHVSTYFVAVL